MTIKPITKEKESSFNKHATHPLQSWEWGEFRKSTGNEILRFGIYQKGKLTSSFQIMVHSIPLLKYKIGSLIKGPKLTKKQLLQLKEIGKKNNIIFIKLEPNIIKDKKLIVSFKSAGAVPGKTLFTPTTFWIDLDKPTDKLLESFHSKTRYNIRLAERKGVSAEEDNSDKAFEKYLKLTKETIERQGFYAHTEDYHRKMWKALNQDLRKKGKSPIARLLVAKYKGEIITTWIVFVWNGILYYPYGASSSKYRNLMANNLVMWKAILYGKSEGLKTFDLWGREPGKGFTRFKEGYNPKIITFSGSWDLVISPLYYLYRPLDQLRWFLLRTRTKLGFARPTF